MINNTAIIIQARMNSTRLPGKVLRKINEHPMIYYLLKRIEFSKIKKIYVATSNKYQDDEIETYINKNFKNIEIFRGSENNVFSRFYEIANMNKFENIIRITADCPLIDYRLIDKMYKHFINSDNLDYLSNTTPHSTRTYPDGMDVELFSIKAINKANKLDLSKTDLEHVTNCFLDIKNNFIINRLDNEVNLKNFKLSVDSLADFNLVSDIIKNVIIYKIDASMNEIIEYLNDKKNT